MMDENRVVQTTARLIASIHRENDARKLRLAASNAEHEAAMMASRAQRAMIPDMRSRSVSKTMSPLPQHRERTESQVREAKLKMQRALSRRMGNRRLTPQGASLALRAQRLHEHQMMKESALGIEGDYQPNEPNALSRQQFTPTTYSGFGRHLDGHSKLFPASSPTSSVTPRPHHHIVKSQTWNTDLAKVHSRMDSIKFDRSLMKHFGGEYTDYMDFDSEKKNEDLMRKTLEYAEELRRQKQLEQKREEEAKKYVPRPVMNKIRHFVDDRRAAARREVLGLLAVWMPPSFDVPVDPVISPVAGVATRNEFEKAYSPSLNTKVDSSSFYSIIQMETLNHENQLDELLRRNGKFVCPGNMSLVFPMGRMEDVVEGKTLTILICKTNPGRAYWMDEADMGGLSRRESTVLLPMDPPEDFDSICLFGRKGVISSNGKRRSSLEGIGDPLDPIHEYYRYLVHDPSRAIAMWCVTFKPVRRSTREKKERAERESQQLNSTGMDSKKQSPGKFHRRWQRRADRLKAGAKNSHMNDMADIVIDADKKFRHLTPDQMNDEPSWEDAPHKAVEADRALDQYKSNCEAKKMALRKMLKSLHKRLESVYENYATTQQSIHDGLRGTLTEIQVEKQSRSNAVAAWKLQLLQHQLNTVRAVQIRRKAETELADDEMDAYNRLFVPIAESDAKVRAPPGWNFSDPSSPPVKDEIAIVNVHGLHSKEEGDVGFHEGQSSSEWSSASEASVEDFRRGNEGTSTEVSDADFLTQSQQKQARSPIFDLLGATTGEKSKKKKSRRSSMIETSASSTIVKGSAPTILVGKKRVAKRRMSLIEMKNAYKNVGMKSNSSDENIVRDSNALRAIELESEAKSSEAAGDIVNAFLGSSSTTRTQVAQDGEASKEELPDVSEQVISNETGASVNSSTSFEQRVLQVLPSREASENLTSVQSRMDMPAQKEGWLLHRGELNNAKARMWFVLEASRVSWKEGQYSTSEKGSVKLQRATVTVDENSDVDFFLKVPGLTYYLSAESSESRQEWITSISKNAQIDRAHLRLQKVRNGGLLGLFPRGETYLELDKLIRGHLEISKHLDSQLDLTKSGGKQIVETLAPALFYIFRFRGLMQACNLVSYTLKLEIDRTKTLATLFRRNSLATKMFDALMSTGDEIEFGSYSTFLKDVMSPVFNSIVANVSINGKSGLELDPFKISSLDDKLAKCSPDKLQATLQKKVDALGDICHLFLDQVEKALGKISPLKCMVLLQIADDLVKKFSGGDRLKSSTSKSVLEGHVISLLFLRTFCPELIKKDACQKYAVTKVKSKEFSLVRRAQTLVAIVLQKMANGRRFQGSSSAYLVPMNEFMDSHSERLASMYRKIEDRSKEVSSSVNSIMSISDEIASVSYGDVDIEALASALHTLHGTIYDMRSSYDGSGVESFRKLRRVLQDLDIPSHRFTKMYGNDGAQTSQGSKVK